MNLPRSYITPPCENPCAFNRLRRTRRSSDSVVHRARYGAVPNASTAAPPCKRFPQDVGQMWKTLHTVGTAPKPSPCCRPLRAFSTGHGPANKQGRGGGPVSTCVLPGQTLSFERLHQAGVLHYDRFLGTREWSASAELRAPAERTGRPPCALTARGGPYRRIVASRRFAKAAGISPRRRAP